MEKIVVHCSWADAEVLRDTFIVSRLPLELVHLIQSAIGSRYFETIASAALIPQCTDKIFTLYRPLVAEIAARWLERASGGFLANSTVTLSGLIRILPFTPYLRPYVRELFTGEYGMSKLTDGTMSLLELTEEQLTSLLLSLFRLFTYDVDTYGDFVHPALIPPLFHHSSFLVRYLAIQCFVSLMRFADAFSEKLIQFYIGNLPIMGKWEGNEIDYRLLKLFEERRWERLEEYLCSANAQRQRICSGPVSARFSADDLSARTVEVAGVLMPRIKSQTPRLSRFVQTPTAYENLQKLVEALLDVKPVLLSGRPGSGKTSLIVEAARALNRLPTMITLQLNEQTDAKSLLGVYTTSKSGESFVWQPGVLTRAVQEGRWVLIEDLERAPSEVLGILRPIFERGELYLPNRKESVRPADGFRVLATIRSLESRPNSSSSHLSFHIDHRFWSVVEVAEMNAREIEAMVRTRFPALTLLVESIMLVHHRIVQEYRENTSLRYLQTRSPTLRDLFKWCRRIKSRLAPLNSKSIGTAIPEGAKFDMLKDALDCYAGHLSQNVDKRIVANFIANEMQIPPRQLEHILKQQLTTFSSSASEVKIGREFLSVAVSHKRNLHFARAGPFALTRHARRTMESIAAGARYAEPVLLVGETGVGKTTLVQHIATIVGQELTVVNLSQQSEASDLLGGLKPITTQSMVQPLADQFAAIFEDTFSTKRNEKFQSSIRKAIARHNWQRLLLLWQEALQMAENALKEPSNGVDAELSTHQNKRRKVLTTKYQALRERWALFAISVKQFRVQLQRGDSHPTFGFVEGRLVKAVRTGEWLLLDEINLASSDTLDHIITLLQNGDDGRPFLMLAETGNVEQINAHPDFRVFAAMNPANDAGKKDLAPGLRSRFTEIYVQPGDDEVDDLVDLINAYLGALLSVDKWAAADLANTYLKVRKLNEEHRLTDGAGDVPHFSLRSLVRCLQFVALHAATFGLRRAIYEGFAMSFFTMLSRESEHLVLPVLHTHVLSRVKNPQSFLAQTPKLSFDNEYINFKHHAIRKGQFPLGHEPHYIITPSVERNILNLARAASMHRFPILLQGPTSSGKTSMVEYLANMTGNKFVRINNHEHTDIQEYLGSYSSGTDGRLRYEDGVLVDALRQGHWIVLDELNLAPSDVLEALNRLLDDNRELLIPESQEIVRPHQNFMLFATQNPAGVYGGRKRLSRAFRNRFLELHFDDIPEEELEVILRERSQIAPSFCTQIVAVYKRLSMQRQSSRLFEQRDSFATLRDLFRWAARPVDDRVQLARHGFMLLAERVRDPTERLIVKKIIEEVMRVVIDEKELYGQSVIPSDLLKSTSVVWTPAMRRLYVLVSKALGNNEPVLLVGETGCGKTQICQIVAQALKNRLHTYNAHTNTETGDLIGSQRPLRNKSELAKTLRQDLLRLNQPLISGVDAKVFDIDGLILEFNQMDTSSLDRDIVSQTRANIAAYQSLFQWFDGSLVRAMKKGEIFLLDEISLAEDSVLERLNSVLEPSRTILLAEKGSNDNLVTASPNFQFLATMNPGGDYGKRELSAALRNRLTEIWVPALTEDTDVLPILQTKLGRDCIRFAQPMLEFAHWFREHFSNSQSKPIPLRSLLAWTEFMNKCSRLSVENAFVHGAAMVFLDSLGADPAGITTTSITDIHNARMKCLRKLDEVPDCNLTAIYAQNPDLYIDATELRIGDFALNRGKDGKDITEMIFEAPTTIKNTMRLVRALQMPRPILLEGSPGVGKTAIVTSLASIVGKQLTRINLSDQTDIMDLFGADVPAENENIGQFSWRDGPLLRAMQSGDWVLLDEMNLASQSVLEGLNSCLDHRQEVFVAELDRTFKCHPEFKLFAAQNPHQHGGGRKGLPSSFVNRFTVVYADPLNKDDLEIISHKRFPCMPYDKLIVILEAITEIQKLFSENPSIGMVGGPWEFNLRDVSRWLNLSSQFMSLNPLNHFDTLVTQRFRTFAQKLLAQKAISLASDSLELSLYHNLAPNSYQIGTSHLRRDERFQLVTSKQPPIPTDLLPYAKSIITGINQKWPIILSGSSGCGKAMLIRHLAALSGTRLVEFSLNSDVDTMDLIGGFEQYEPLRELMALREDLGDCIRNKISQKLFEVSPPALLTTVLNVYRTCTATELDSQILRSELERLSKLDTEFLAYLERLESLSPEQSSSQMRFAWNDGVLIDALQQGSWLVLQNANLCSPSVLDRLNSLLEPDGGLVISEKHSTNNGAQVINPHPNFRIFLTIDPRYGELTRAMRNRSLEIHIVSSSLNRENKQALKYPCASGISRLRHFNHGLENVHGLQSEMIGFASDHLSANEIQSLDLTSFQALNNSTTAEICNEINFRRSLPLFVYEQDQLMYQSLHEKFPFIPSTHYQPSLMVLNEPLTLIIGNETFANEVKHVAQIRQILRELSGIRTKLESVTNGAATHRLVDLSLLQISSREGFRSRNHATAAIPGFFKFLESVCALVYDLFLAESKSKVLFPEYVQNAREIVAYARDILLLSNQKVLEMAVFQGYMQVANQIIKKIKSSNLARSHFEKALGIFHFKYDLRSGQGLERMWDKWRPFTVSTDEQLRAFLSLEELMRRFDSVSKTVRGSRTVLGKTRSQLVRTQSFIIAHNGDLESFRYDLEEIVSKLESQNQNISPPIGHFVETFKFLTRTIALQKKVESDGSLDPFSLLMNDQQENIAVSPTGSIVPEILSKISNHVALEIKNHKPLSLNGQDGLVLVKEVFTCDEQRLGDFTYALEEIDILAKSLCHHSRNLEPDFVSNFRDHVLVLLVEIWKCHQDLLTEDAVNLLSLANSSLILQQLTLLWQNQTVFHEEVPIDHFFRTISSDWLVPVASLLHAELGDENRYAGAIIFNFCMASLHLLVPDQPFDPAIFPAVARERYVRRTYEIKSRLEAIQLLESRFSGQVSTAYTRLVEQELLELGDEPPAPLVMRPAESGLAPLQEEFSNLLRFIVHKEPGNIMLSQFEGRWKNPSIYDHDRVEEAKRLRQNISGVVSRLATVNRAYDDISKPIVWTLKCLSFGVDLLAAASTPETETGDGLQQLTSHIPMFGGSPATISSWDFKSLGQLQNRPDYRFTWLQHLCLQRGVQSQYKPFTPSESISNFLLVVDSFHQEWKSNLTKDQELSAIKSRYYAYRGKDDNDDEATEAETAELFPLYEDSIESSSSFQQGPYDARDIAVKVAELHESIWSPESPQDISEHVLRSLQELARMVSNRHGLWSHSSFISFLPANLLQLESKLESLQRTSPLKKINIYTDWDIVESKKLHFMVHQIQYRFKEVQQSWPEHALPAEVLLCCQKILEFKLKDPIAKLLTKTEKLFEIIAQWETVASREFSASELQEELSALIISWRQLELSSWSQLLDLEMAKHEHDTQAWYFLVYEAILVNPRQILDDKGDIAAYSLELAQTLQELLTAATRGQFAFRLRLVSAAEATLSTMVRMDGRLAPVALCVSNIYRHYQRYESALKSSLETDRQQLEKAVQEQIKLASWKDTNPTTLRDSSRRSHHKLFKIVRKYRVLLNQPIGILKASPSPKIDGDGFLEINQLQSTLKSRKLDTALAHCQNKIVGWWNRPERLRNPLGSASSMRRIYLIQANGFTPNIELATYQHSLGLSIKELRSQTPGTLSDDNQSLVRHLRERKRRLFADTLKFIANMGVKRSLGTTELDMQASTARVLASSPDIDFNSYPELTHSGNEFFHELLDCMPGVRVSLVNHSEDLTDSEVRRSVGYIEGLLSILMKQRASIHKFLLDIRMLGAKVATVRNVEKTAPGELVFTSSNLRSRHDLYAERLAWLREILKLSSRILEIHARHAGCSTELVRNLLQSYQDTFETFGTRMQKEISLPEGLCRKKDIDVLNDIQRALGEFHTALIDHAKAEPGINYIIKQMVPWTEIHENDIVELLNGHKQLSFEEFDSVLRNSTDQIFVAMQQLVNVSDEVQSIEDNGWLAKSDAKQKAVIKALHVPQIAESLERVFSSIHGLQPVQISSLHSLLVASNPIFEQYHHICCHVAETSILIHRELSQLALSLAKSFTSLTSEGFCSPAEASKGDEKQGQVESGTGLGDGEGAEDISKDVGDDEDLTELAEADRGETKDDQLENSNDAVDMGAEELNGQFQSFEEAASDEDDVESGSENEDGQDMGEEVGSVDDLDPSAVDEKLWDDAKQEVGKELQNDKAKGSKSDDQAAADPGNKDSKSEVDDELDGTISGAEEDSGDDEAPAARPDAEKTDPYAQDENVLELPEELHLNGEEKMDEGDISDGGMDEFSDDDDGRGSEVSGVKQSDNGLGDLDMDDEDQQIKQDDDIKSSGDEESANGAIDRDEITEDQSPSETEGEHELTRSYDNEMQYDFDEQQHGEEGAAGGPEDTLENEKGDQANIPSSEQRAGLRQNQPSDTANTDDVEDGNGVREYGQGRQDEPGYEQNETLKRLAEVLDKWHRRREILASNDQMEEDSKAEDVDMMDADFEHVQGEEEGDAQALGVGANDHSQNLDQGKAAEDENLEDNLEVMVSDAEENEANDQESIEDQLSRLRTDPTNSADAFGGAFVPEQDRNRILSNRSRDEKLSVEDSLDEGREQGIVSSMRSSERVLRTQEDASRLWSHYSATTHQFSLVLTEQLRLILAPTLATKLRGDFRTGKRLNIKRIIPYIASQYKRDKIWMRRSVPSKRNYQIMIAIDDSKSMMEGGTWALAFETLAMLCKSMSMLEVGEICVVGFGNEEHVRVAHPFGNPFSNEACVQIFQNFSFNQIATDVKKLVAESILLFQDARARATSTQSDLWQLELIISDGICQDHDDVQRLVRQAAEEKIMIVFVIVDSVDGSSIMDLTQASFEPDESADGEMKLSIRRYLERFPFPYYLVVRDVRDLPTVLATALKGWFAQVVDVQ